MPNDKQILFLEHAVARLYHRVEELEKGFIYMAESFDALSAAIDRAVALISEAVTELNDPNRGPSNQALIDSLTSKLTSAADALSGAEVPAPAVEPAPAADAPVDDTPVDPAA